MPKPTYSVDGHTITADAMRTKIIDTMMILEEQRETAGAANGLGCSPTDIVTAWGDERWQAIEGKTEVGQLMWRMAANKKAQINRIGHGLYTVAARFVKHQIGTHDSIEHIVLPAMIANGGFITFAKVRELFDVEAPKGSLTPLRMTPRKRTKRPSIDRLAYEQDYGDGMPGTLRDALTKSSKIVHHAHGVWRLANLVLSTIPLEARNVVRLAVEAQEPRKRPGYDVVEFDKENRATLSIHTDRLGEVYARQRYLWGHSLDDVLDDPKISDAVDATAERLHSYRLGFEEFMRMETRPARQERNYPAAYWRAVSIADFRKVVIEMFEDGVIDAHLVAYSDWHKAFASLWRLSAADLSRGIIVTDDTVPGWDDIAAQLVEKTLKESREEAWLERNR